MKTAAIGTRTRKGVAVVDVDVAGLVVDATAARRTPPLRGPRATAARTSRLPAAKGRVPRALASKRFP